MIRSNFATDDAAARAYVEGILALKDPVNYPWPGNAGLSVYDFFVFWHARTMMAFTPPTQNDRNAAHSGPAFLPWHRYMLLRLEDWLRFALGDDNFRLPYWDWTTDADRANPSQSPVWSADRLGRFAQSTFRVRVAMNSAGRIVRTDRMLSRALGTQGGLPQRRAVQTVIREQSAYDAPPYNSDSPGFRNFIEGWLGPAGIHNTVHVWVGGDMLLATSPNDPAFFLHHCNVDRIWSAWQQRWPASPYVPPQTASPDLAFHRANDPLYTFFDERITPAAMFDHAPLYRYDTLQDLIG